MCTKCAKIYESKNLIQPREHLFPNNLAEWGQYLSLLTSASSDIHVHGLQGHKGQLLFHLFRTPSPPAVHRGEHDHVDVPTGIIVVAHIDVGHIVVVIVVIIVVVIVVFVFGIVLIIIVVIIIVVFIIIIVIFVIVVFLCYYCCYCCC